MSYQSIPIKTLGDELADSDKSALVKAIMGTRQSNGNYVTWPSSNDGHPFIEIVDPTTAFGEISVAHPFPMIQASFEYNVNAALVTSTVTGSGTVTQGSSMAVLSTTTATSSSSRVSTVRSVPYRMGQGSLFRFTGLFTLGVTGSTQIYGAIDTENGFAFGYNEDSFGILHRQNSVDTWLPKSSWNIDKLDGTGASNMVLDPTSLNVYQISMQHLGTGGIIFSVEDADTRSFIPVHLLIRANAYTTPTIYRANLPITAQVTNTTNNTNIVIKCICMAGFIEGSVNWLGTRRSQYASKASIGTTSSPPTPIISLRCPTTGGGGYTTNKAILVLKEINGAATSNQAGEIQIFRNATLTGASFADVDNTQTPAQIDTSASSMTGGRLLYSGTIGGNVTSVSRKEWGDFEVLLSPGDIITLAGFSYSSTVTIRGALSWIDVI